MLAKSSNSVRLRLAWGEVRANEVVRLSRRLEIEIEQ